MIAFKEELFLLRKEPDVEIWYQDECGVSGDSRPRLVWSRKGKRPILPFTGAHFKDNVIGAVRPADGKFFSLIMPTSNTRSFQIFLDETQRHIQSRRAVMILDNASWHKPKMLDWGAYSRFTFLLTRLISIPSNASG
ncbi:MAG TPA: transposase [bacterium]|nr:transposase [bacterium]